MSKFDFQLAYTIKPHNAPRDETDAAQARLHLREKLGLDTVEHIETTLLGMITLNGTSLADRKREAEKLVRDYIHDALKGLTDFSEAYQTSWDRKSPLFRRVQRGAGA